MRVIKLYGNLRKKFGKFHRYQVKNTAEAIKALCANFPDFERELATAHESNIGYRVFTGKHELSNENEVNDPSSGDIRIVPVVMGSNATTRILVGAVLIVAGAVALATGVGAGAAPYLFSAGASLVLGGVIELLSPIAKIKEPAESPENKPSYIFNGPVNTTSQGHPVPIGYGRLMVGGGVVSAGINIDQIMAGYKRVTYERKIVVYCYSNDPLKDGNCIRADSSGLPIPTNFFRRELAEFHDFYEEIGEDWAFDRYQFVYNYYYYETVLELIS